MKNEFTSYPGELISISGSSQLISDFVKWCVTTRLMRVHAISTGPTWFRAFFEAEDAKAATEWLGWRQVERCAS